MKKEDVEKIIYAFSLLGYLGFVIAFNIIMFIFIYILIAKIWRESVILLIFFILIGIISAFYNAYKILLKKK